MTPDTQTDRDAFGRRPIKSAHTLHQTDWFSDDALAQIIDRLPRKNLRVWCENRASDDGLSYMYVDTTGLSGREIIDCVHRGAFWVNLQRVDKVVPEIRDGAAQLYASLAEQCPRFQFDFIHCYILVSSPRMYFQLHVDSYENMFWCTRGGKDFHLYPPAHPSVAPLEFMEDICTGVREDFLPRVAENESLRQTIRIAPGDLLSWPQHSPHEFDNNEHLNVGLGTFHGNDASLTRIQNYQASYWFRENAPGLRGSRFDHRALGTQLRRQLWRGIKRFGGAAPGRKINFWTQFRLDPAQPDCMLRLDQGPILAECSR